MDRTDRMLRDGFINELMIGVCPQCGSNNVHDCQAPVFFMNVDKTEIHKMGSECQIARELDDSTIGHCDDCDYLWCLDCNLKLTQRSGACRHYEICDLCNIENNRLSDDEFEEQVCRSCENWDNGCLLEEPISYCEKLIQNYCLYAGQIMLCPTIKQSIHDT